MKAWLILVLVGLVLTSGCLSVEDLFTGKFTDVKVTVGTEEELDPTCRESECEGYCDGHKAVHRLCVEGECQIVGEAECRKSEGDYNTCIQPDEHMDPRCTRDRECSEDYDCWEKSDKIACEHNFATRYDCVMDEWKCRTINEDCGRLGEDYSCYEMVSDYEPGGQCISKDVAKRNLLGGIV